jgi:predicted nucleic acid-binding protein
LRQLVADASVVVRACLAASGFTPLDGFQLVSPPLVRSESLSALHELAWRGEISAELASIALDRLRGAPIEVIAPDDLHDAAWSLADALGWAKTYDAEYVALARSLDCPLVTLDSRLIRGASSVASVIGPADVPTLA